MGHRCALTGKRTRFGNNVSHSNTKTRRRFLPNVQKVSLHSEVLGRPIRLQVSTRALRSVQKKGGIDLFLLRTDDAKLTPEALRLKRRIRNAMAAPSTRTAAN